MLCSPPVAPEGLASWCEPSLSPGWGLSGVHLGLARGSWFRVEMWEWGGWALIRAVHGPQQHTLEVRVSGGVLGLVAFVCTHIQDPLIPPETL